MTYKFILRYETLFFIFLVELLKENLLKKLILIEKIKKELSLVQYIRGSSALLAVSGGPDSMVMLYAIESIAKDLGFSFSVATVNHEIRSHEESSGDADFVCETCKKLNIKCYRKDLKPGEVSGLAKQRKSGIEDAARVLRYDFFNSLKIKYNFDFIFLAHNKNDQEETLLMRFLQGSGAMYGIEAFRSPFVRPLLSVSRQEIIDYAKENSIDYKIDATNSDTNYLRNNIRHNLVPVLDKVYPGWKTAIIAGAEKALLDSKAIESWPESKDIWSWQYKITSPSCDSSIVSGMLYTDAKRFYSFPMAVRIKKLFEGCNILEKDVRIPFAMIKSFSEPVSDGKILKGNGFFVEVCKNRLFLSIVPKISPLTLEITFKTLYSDTEKCFGPFSQMPQVTFMQPNEEICFSNGVKRLLKDLFSSEGIPCSLRKRIPIISGKFGEKIIKIIAGSAFGFRDWRSVPQEIHKNLEKTTDCKKIYLKVETTNE